MAAHPHAASQQPRVILSDEFHQALISARVVSGDERIRRLVIDAQAGHVLMVHVERSGDERLLQVLPSLVGVDVITGQPEGAEAGTPGSS